MKDWLTAMEIAAAALPGLPATERGVQLLAARASWPSRPRAGRGGGVEYRIDVLPAEARLAYVTQAIGAVELPLSVLRDAAAEPEAMELSAVATDARDLRLWAVRTVDHIQQAAGVSRKIAIVQFCAAFNAGEIELPRRFGGQLARTTYRTVARWDAHVRRGHTARLGVDRAANRRGSAVLDRANGGAVKTYILALLAKQPQLTAHHIRPLVADRFGQLTIGAKPVALPPIRTFQHTLKGWRAAFRNELKRARDPDGYKSTVRFTARVARPADHLNQLWQIDASPADVLTTEGRHSIYVCVDIYSRRLIGLVTKTPRAAAVGLLLRKAILAWGVPEKIKTDNGSDFVAHATKRLLSSLAVEADTARPFSPEQKGHIERAIGTVQHSFMRTLPGFVGHSVADRKVIEGRKSFARRLGEATEELFAVELTPAELQLQLDQWCGDVYAHRPHAGLSGRTPFQAAASAAITVRTVDARSLDVLLAPVAGKDGIRTVTKSGVRIDRHHYIAGFLEVGAEVMVRMDAADLGRALVFDRAGEAYLGEAICPDLAGINPATMIAAVRAEQKRREDEALAAVRRIPVRAADLAPAIHRQALKDAGSLVEFPKRMTDHETPAIAAARAAAEGGDLTPKHSAEVEALHVQLVAEEARAASNVKPLRDEETPHQLWNKARAMEAALGRGERPSDEELLWLGSFRQGPIYRGFAMTYGVEVRAEKTSARWRPGAEA